MPDRQQTIDIISRTHQIFCGLRGKDLTLLYDNPPGRTDTETFISIPIEDPEAELILAHEWQHIVFKSNIRARTQFSDSYAAALKARLPDLNELMMGEFIHLLVNGLDDLRVCSLWKLIYPHSAGAIQDRWRRIILDSGRYQHDIIMFLMGLALGLEDKMNRSEWMRYKGTLKDAVSKVILRGFPTCLLAARWVIESTLRDVSMLHTTPKSYNLLPPKPIQYIPSSGTPTPFQKAPEGAARVTPEEGALQVTSLIKLHHGSTKPSHHTKQLNASWSMGDMTVQPVGLDPEWESTASMVSMAMGVSNPTQVEKVLERSQLDVERILSELKNRSKVLTPSQRLLKGLEGSVEVRLVKASEVDDLVLYPSDEQIVQTLRHSFTRLMDRKRQVTSDSGSTLDPQAYIDFLNGSSNTDIFVDEESSKGFSAIILLDMSGSMREKWRTVSRACKVISKAMKFPTTRLEVWGFTSTEHGVASMLRFENPEKGYSGPGVGDVWGLTPLPQAVDVSIRRLHGMPGSVQHLLVLTDGYPTSLRSSHSKDSESLFVEVARHIQAGRKKGVNTVGLLSGYEVNDAAATLMFGHPRFWERVSENQEDLFNSLIALAKKSFVSYLRTT
jgi:hypothetical protein